MLHFDDAPPRKARIEIIPMIDVMMFLLIFFVLISLNVIPTFGLKTALPHSSTSQKVVTRQQPMVVTVGAAGQLALNGEAISADALTQRVHALHQQDPEQRVVINADHTVPWQSVVDVMDALRKAGVEGMTFATQRPR
jgi:biopolymer transport protein ExbD